jgi:endonuclease/exonuclease/phosphatase family metal-dependent hydrolase
LKYKVWEYRSKLFLNLFSNKAIISDLYCFVEVDKQDDIYLMLNNIVNQKLFETVFFQRPSTPLGIMLLYNRVKFKLIKSYKYYLGTNINQNFALVALMQENFFPNNFFVIIITHLIARDKNEKARIKQINKLFYNLSNDTLIKNLKINKIILCGDLNTNPDSECVNIILKNNFKSVFDISNKENDNYTIVIDTIDEGLKKLKFDYIFISDNINIKNKIIPLNFLDFEKGLPNENFPSDHIYLFTEFEFCPKNQEVIFDFDKIIYDKNLNYELNMVNDKDNKEKNKEEKK